MTKVSFNSQNTLFYNTLKSKVDNYFISNNLCVSGGWRLFFKSLFLIASLVGLYVTLVFFTPNVWVSVLLCCFLGLTFAAIGFNIMHEGGHGSFSKNKILNAFGAYSLNIMGGTIYFWKQKHNINHHTYTNIDGMDHDIDIKFMRMHSEQEKHGYHKYQHLYWVVLYGISYMAWILFQDFEKYFTQKMGPKDSPRKMAFQEHLIFWSTKVFYVSVYLVIPMLMVGVLPTIAGFLIAGFVCGYSISIVFQLAHVIEGTQFPVPHPATNKIEEEWAVHQVTTTANFATRSKLVSWFVGGLNFQVEHHLFPRISHIHYPQINKFVIETCKEFNVRYIEHPTVLSAFVSHLTHIKNLGDPVGATFKTPAYQPQEA
ncbi:fatty acid desaturase family protein [Paradesertivirga mongoliensis]|uniref:Fatty acid desaturase family protein n=1 Tax=Paradesertivirga mongoliensis TaxID=2100740 RepID=A0ABW4ZKR7_9SPHI|nr:acyl-CoA desaturase [Pedobacter mongoliensis]